MTSTASIPTIALSSGKANQDDLVKSIQQALRTLGFLYVTHSSLDLASIAKLFEISRIFFTQTTAIEKAQCARHSDNLGYVAFNAEQLDPTKHNQRDSKEAFNLGRLSLQQGIPVARTQVVPSTLQSHLPALYEFQEACRSICLEILKSLAISFGLPEDFFSSQHQATQEDLSILRLLFYPASEPQVPQLASPTNDGSRIRAGAHSDYGSLTLLFQEPDGPTGLQVLDSVNRSDAEPEVWKDVAVHPGAILVNIGDALEFWTGGQLKSTVHRVVQPTRPDDIDRARFSVAYFCQPDPDAMLKNTLKHPIDPLTRSRLESKGILLSESITSRDYLARRLAITYL